MPTPFSEDTASFLARISPKAIYGIIVQEALLGALRDPLPGNLTIMVSVVASVAAISLAGAYSQLIADDIVNRTVTPWNAPARMLLGLIFRPNWMLATTVVPVCFFGLAAVGVLTQKAAMGLTTWTFSGLLFLLGFLLARFSGARPFQSTLSGLMVALVGFVVIQVKMFAKLL